MENAQRCNHPLVRNATTEVSDGNMMHDTGVNTSGEWDDVYIGLTTHRPCFKNRKKLNSLTRMTTWEYEENNKVRRGRNEQHILVYLDLIDNNSHKHESRRKGNDCCWWETRRVSSQQAMSSLVLFCHPCKAVINTFCCPLHLIGTTTSPTKKWPY